MIKYYISLALFNIVEVTSIVLYYHNYISLIIPIACVIIYISLLAFFSFNISSQFYIPAICSGNQKKKQISLTFDDGPLREYTPEMLDILASHKVKAAFFCTGKSIKSNKVIAERIVAEGHIIGNHTWSHSYWFDFFTSKMMVNELNETDKIIKEITGSKPLFFRPPYGVTNPSLSRALKKMDYTVIGWSFRTYDTIIKDQKKMIDRILRKIDNGSILNFHDYNQKMISILPELINAVRNEGFSIEPLNILIERKPYV
jgi:peptidoglycan/xylan/chitin deacetylase (PgdA/CDA1 family)